MNFKSSWVLLKETLSAFQRDHAIRLAAATAYYAVFSIGPLLVLVVGLAGLVFGQNRVGSEVSRQVESFVGPKAANLIQSMMNAQYKGDSLLATLMGAAALVVGATGAFGQLQDSLNAIWGVTAKPGRSVSAFLRARLFSAAMVLSIGFLLLVSMALSAFVNAFAGYVGHLISQPKWLAPALNDVCAFLVISVLFALLFKFLPDLKIRWRDVWHGAVGTALLFTAGKFLLGFYLAHAASASAYGAGAAFIAILLYVYYASLILYIGAEFTKVCAWNNGAKIEPNQYAVWIDGKARSGSLQQGQAGVRGMVSARPGAP